MTTAKNVMKMIKDNDVKYVDFRFTDPRGKWQHVTFDVTMIEEDTFAEGQMFDGSSIAGWKAINESDMNLRPSSSFSMTSSILRSLTKPGSKSTRTSFLPTPTPNTKAAISVTTSASR